MSYNPYREIVKRLFSERHRVEQPVPDVNDEDVTRIAVRDFSEEQLGVVTAVPPFSMNTGRRNMKPDVLASILQC